MKDPFNNEVFNEIKPHIVAKFKKFHMDNPHVYPLFKRFSFEAMKSGRNYFSTQMILERIRWYIEIETKGDVFKINNNHAPCYARLLMVEHPELGNFFRRRVTNRGQQNLFF
jgi:hypothetical protein